MVDVKEFEHRINYARLLMNVTLIIVIIMGGKLIRNIDSGVDDNQVRLQAGLESHIAHQARQMYLMCEHAKSMDDVPGVSMSNRVDRVCSRYSTPAEALRTEESIQEQIEQSIKNKEKK